MTSDTPPPLIYQQIIEVMRLVGAIGKDQKNHQQRFSFRGIDDIYNALHGHLSDAGVFTVPEVLEERSEERQTKSGTNLIYRVLKIKFTFYAEDGSNVSATVIGEGMDSGDKASNKAMSIAHKYAFLQVFCIPTEEPKDPDFDTHSVLPTVANRTKAAPVYDETKAKHKGMLAGLCKTNGVTDPDTMRGLSSVAKSKKVKLDELKTFLEREIRERKEVGEI